MTNTISISTRVLDWLARGMLLALLAGLAFSVWSVCVLPMSRNFAGRPSPVPKEMPWEAYSPDRLAALRLEGTAVLVDYTCDWDLLPRLNTSLALDVPATIEHFHKWGVVPMVADFTRQPLHLYEEIKSFGRAGPPLVVYYPSHGGPPVVMPVTLLGPEDVLGPIRKAEGR